MSDKKAFPEHVAIILDGNGRWARERGRERTYGHQVGAAHVKTIVRAAGHMGIKVLTLYAFSTENWKRPSLEVRFLMKLFKNHLISQLKELVEDNVQVHIVAIRPSFPKAFGKALQSASGTRPEITAWCSMWLSITAAVWKLSMLCVK